MRTKLFFFLASATALMSLTGCAAESEAPVEDQDVAVSADELASAPRVTVVASARSVTLNRIVAAHNPGPLRAFSVLNAVSYDLGKRSSGPLTLAQARTIAVAQWGDEGGVVTGVEQVRTSGPTPAIAEQLSLREAGRIEGAITMNGPSPKPGPLAQAIAPLFRTSYGKVFRVRFNPEVGLTDVYVFAVNGPSAGKGYAVTAAAFVPGE